MKMKQHILFSTKSKPSLTASHALRATSRCFQPLVLLRYRAKTYLTFSASISSSWRDSCFISYLRWIWKFQILFIQLTTCSFFQSRRFFLLNYFMSWSNTHYTFADMFWEKNWPIASEAMNTAWNMWEYGFLLTYILPYVDRIYNSILIRENTGEWKPEFSHNLHRRN